MGIHERPDLPTIMRDIVNRDAVNPHHWERTYELYSITPEQVSEAVEAERKNRADVELLRRREPEHGE